MSELDAFLNTLEMSLKKNGDKPLTLSHLKNLVKKTIDGLDKEAEQDLMGSGPTDID